MFLFLLDISWYCLNLAEVPSGCFIHQSGTHRFLNSEICIWVYNWPCVSILYHAVREGPGHILPFLVALCSLSPADGTRLEAAGSCPKVLLETTGLVAVVPLIMLGPGATERSFSGGTAEPEGGQEGSSLWSRSCLAQGQPKGLAVAAQQWARIEVLRLQSTKQVDNSQYL